MAPPQTAMAADEQQQSAGAAADCLGLMRDTPPTSVAAQPATPPDSAAQPAAPQGEEEEEEVEEEEEEHHPKLDMRRGIVSVPSWDLHCFACDKGLNEQDVYRKCVNPRKCPCCRDQMHTWRTRGSISSIFKPLGDKPSSRELKSNAAPSGRH